MKILVTGGKGVVGSSLVRELRAQGEQVGLWIFTAMKITTIVVI